MSDAYLKYSLPNALFTTLEHFKTLNKVLKLNLKITTNKILGYWIFFMNRYK